MAAAVLIGAAPTPSRAADASLAGYICQGAQLTLFDNTNSGDVVNGGSQPTFSTNGKAYCLTYIQTYHWNGGQGSAPGGFVGITRVSGPGQLDNGSVSYPAQTSSGQNGAANVNWYADVPIAPKPVILDGTYQCKDSAPGTWSSDHATGGAGFCIVDADPAVPGPTPRSSAAATAAASPPAAQSAAPVASGGVASSGSGGIPLAPVGISVAALAVVATGVVVVTRLEMVEDFFADCDMFSSSCRPRQRPNPFDDFELPPPGIGPIPAPVDDKPVPIAGDSAGPVDDVM